MVTMVGVMVMGEGVLGVHVAPGSNDACPRTNPHLLHLGSGWK